MMLLVTIVGLALLLVSVCWIITVRRDKAKLATFARSYHFTPIQELYSLRYRYLHAEGAARAALADEFLRRATDLDVHVLPPDLYALTCILRREKEIPCA